ncbi:MAG: hypothetical protein PVF74_08985 [Anaerolineales bacterium]
MTKQERMIAYTFYLLILIGGATLAILLLKALLWTPALLSSVSWNG